jgi:hypothetical protein
LSLPVELGLLQPTDKVKNTTSARTTMRSFMNILPFFTDYRDRAKEGQLTTVQVLEAVSERVGVKAGNR